MYLYTYIYVHAAIATATAVAIPNAIVIDAAITGGFHLFAPNPSNTFVRTLHARASRREVGQG